MPMTDPLDDLERAFRHATPTPDTTRKQANLARAGQIFDAAQESSGRARHTSARPRSWLATFTGVGRMLSPLTSRPALTASTAIVAVGLLALVPTLRDGPPELIVNQPGFIAPQPARNPATSEMVDGNTIQLGDIAEDAASSFSESGNDRNAKLSTMSEGPANRGGTMQKSAPLQIESDGFAGIVAPASPPDATMLNLPDGTTESFANEAANPVKVTSSEPVSTFSIDVDTASYGVVRSSLMNGFLPPPESVRVEEMINYFPYDYAAPGPGEGPFKPTISISQTPWNPGTKLMRIALQGQGPATLNRAPLNLVFLIDTSGSMDQPNKLPLLKQSFRLMLGQLDPQDEVSIVTYAGSAGRVLEPTPASERATILAALDRLNAGGSTAGQQGLQLAYATAQSMASDGELSRVILATDGDFNVGLSDPERLKQFIAQKRDSGTYLSVLGFGRGNLDDATMQALAQNGNGQAAYIDTLSEAQKVLVDQLTGALFPIANDVKIQVEFNPATVAEYRLIGYETRALRREDFNNDRMDAGEIGAGHSVTAIYEITPAGSSAVLNDPLRYDPPNIEAAETGQELAFLRLRYKEPGKSASDLIEIAITEDMISNSADGRFAAAVAGFGQLLQGSPYLGNWSYADAIALADQSVGDDRFGYRREALTLMRLAESLSQ